MATNFIVFRRISFAVIVIIIIIIAGSITISRQGSPRNNCRIKEVYPKLPYKYHLFTKKLLELTRKFYNFYYLILIILQACMILLHQNVRYPVPTLTIHRKLV